MGMVTLMAAPAAAITATVATAANHDPVTNADLAMAYFPKPLASSHVVGGDAAEIFTAMNKFLVQQPYQTRACEDHSHQQLDEVARQLWKFRSEKLASIYQEATDKRQFHFDDIDYKEDLWSKEYKLATEDPHAFGPGSKHYKMVRDGKCAEMVMWWIHHLPEVARNKLSALEGFFVPLLPAKGLVGADLSSVSKEYVYQVSCSDCHSTGENNSTSGGKPIPRSKEAINGVPAGTCDLDVKTNKPSVWYEAMSEVGNRRKRCDWDYDPPCQPCEGIGGYSWGDAEHEISFINCKKIAGANEVPVSERATPIWPKSFIVDEVTTLINQINTGGQFPGADPCAAHKFTNDTEKLYYDGSLTNFSGPIMYTKASHTQIYTLPDADMFIKIMGVFCICVTPHENGMNDRPATGPLRYDFSKDAVYVGREEIGLEGLNMTVVADHFNKGPHHFWISPETGHFVRGWQPWNGLNVYKPGTWSIGAVPKEKFAVPKSCYSGLLHKNISCSGPYPRMI